MAMQDQPPWLAAAWRELGQKEIAGGADNARIVGYFREAGHAAIKDDETAWCAAFLGAMLERVGRRSTRSLRARSYVTWGTGIETPRLGAVAVLTRGSDPALGHVGFVVGETDDALYLLGGNQSNAVTVQAFSRSRLLALRWPDAGGPIVEAPVVATVDSEARFEAALAHVLKMEGGFSDDPYDPGGPTNFGITLRTYATHVGRTLDASSRPGLVAQLRAIAPETVRAIYLRRYWRPAGCAELPPGLDLMHFDAAVNHGVGGAIRFLQRAVHVEADGEIGPITRRAIGRADMAAVIARYAMLREERYRALPHFWRFGRGWLNRVRSTKAAAMAAHQVMRASAEANSHSTTDKGDNTMTTDTGTPATKWWGHSLTVWGAFVTAAAAISPTLGPLIGIDITSEAVRQIGSDMGAIVQAIMGVLGTLMTLYGRARATVPLVRRDMSVRL
jgi:uncharacterized protein (TIGR02594 family)